MDAKEAVGFINVTRQCNVDCKRCYLTEAHRAAKERLPLETLELFLDSHFWFGRPSVIIWEGGEPTVVGNQAMNSYCDLARSVLPAAAQTMVTNCFSVPDWLVDLAFKHFNGRLETTYAYQHKYSLSGDSGVYQAQFIAGLNKFWKAGVECAVNIELNAETIAAGPDALAAVILSSECRTWEFDISVDFQSFLANPVYLASSVPELPLTASYAAVWSYLMALKAKWGSAFKDAGISIGAFEQSAGKANNQFNVACESRFLTLNPDGTVTTNPLYSDLTGTFLGSLANDSMDSILESANRKRRIMAERTRVAPCRNCSHASYCKGGPSHVPVIDGSGECAGGKAMWDQSLENRIA